MERFDDDAGGADRGAAGMARRGLGALLSGVATLWRRLIWALWRFGRAIIIAGVAACLCVGLTVAMATWEVLRHVPESSAALMDGRERGSVLVLDANGQSLGLRGQRFQRITVDTAAPILTEAVMATEDRRFYWHFGVDPLGLARALYVNWRSGRTEQGGSSITQQVAKLAFLSRERRLQRKLRELPLALALEARFTKDEIFSIYLNRVYLGAGSFGFEAAAQRYFGKSAAAVNAAEAAMLAGLLRAPSRWSPTNDFDAAVDRARVILRAMLDAGALDLQGLSEALVDVSAIAPREIDETAPHFVDWVADQIPDSIWRQASDLVVTSTLRPFAQSTAETAMRAVLETQAGRDENAEAALVVLSEDGAVRAMVGGRDYARSQYNRATLARRQLGSAFKPVVYAAALEAGVSPNASIEDAPIRIRDWAPKNYANVYRGWLPMATALAKSSNVAAVRLSQRAGVSAVVEMAGRLGFSEPAPPYPSVALGVMGASPMELASAFSIYRNRGRITPAYGVLEVRDRDSGAVVWSRRAPPPRQAISAQNAEALNGMLREVVLRGTGGRAAMGTRDVAGKTGTTQDYGDAWFAGFTADYTAVAWVGYDDQQRKMHRVTGGSLPAEIWRQAMTPLHAGLPERPVPATHVEHLELDPIASIRSTGGQVRTRSTVRQDARSVGTLQTRPRFESSNRARTVSNDPSLSISERRRPSRRVDLDR